MFSRAFHSVSRRAPIALAAVGGARYVAPNQFSLCDSDFSQHSSWKGTQRKTQEEGNLYTRRSEENVLALRIPSKEKQEKQEKRKKFQKLRKDMHKQGEYQRDRLKQHERAIESFHHALRAIDEEENLGEEEEDDKQTFETRMEIQRLKVRHELANTYNWQSCTEKAVKELKDIVVPGRVKYLGHEHKSTLQSRALLALQLEYSDRLDEAEQMFEEVLESQKKTLGPDHEDTLDTQNDLANLLIKRWKEEKRRCNEEESVRLITKAFEMHQLVWKKRAEKSESGRWTLQAKHNVAKTTAFQENYTRAQELHSEVWKTRNDTGDEHEALISLFHWAEALRQEALRLQLNTHDEGLMKLLRLQESVIKHLYVMYRKETKFRKKDWEMQESYKQAAAVLEELGQAMKAFSSKDSNSLFAVCGEAELIMAKKLLDVKEQKGDKNHDYIKDMKSRGLKKDDKNITEMIGDDEPFVCPSGVKYSVVEDVVRACVLWNRNEKDFTGALIVIGKDSDIPYKQLSRLKSDSTMKCEGKDYKWLSFSETKCKDTFNKDVFTQDGATIVDPETGIVTALFCKLYPDRTKCDYVHEGKGTKHNSALDMTRSIECVAVARSDSGGVTLYSSEMSEKGYCLYFSCEHE